jgi:hypothetical protein
MILRLNKHWKRISKETPEEYQTQFLKDTIALYKTNPSHLRVVYIILMFQALIYYIEFPKISLIIVFITLIISLTDMTLYIKRLNKFYNKYK